MKKIFFILAITALLISSCGNKKQKESTSTHTHSDGSVHAGATHDEAGSGTINQESFEVKNDNDSVHHDEEAEHNHEHGEHN